MYSLLFLFITDWLQLNANVDYCKKLVQLFLIYQKMSLTLCIRKHCCGKLLLWHGKQTRTKWNKNLKENALIYHLINFAETRLLIVFFLLVYCQDILRFFPSKQITSLLLNVSIFKEHQTRSSQDLDILSFVTFIFILQG